MQVDRSRFLFLTASLAAAACNQAPSAASPDTGGADPARSGAQASAEPSTGQSGGPSVWLEIEPGSEDKPVEPGDRSCDNQAGQPSSCSISPPAGHCESFDFTQQVCQQFPAFLQPRAAEAAVDCMLAASGTEQICSWELLSQCTAAGVQASCIDPATEAECASISASCGGGLDRYGCQQTLSAVRPRHVNAVASCVREFCEVSFCVMDLAQFQ